MCTVVGFLFLKKLNGFRDIDDRILLGPALTEIWEGQDERVSWKILVYDEAKYGCQCDPNLQPFA